MANGPKIFTAQSATVAAVNEDYTYNRLGMDVTWYACSLDRLRYKQNYFSTVWSLSKFVSQKLTNLPSHVYSIWQTLLFATLH